jgi:4-hydroxy-2-oxoheptanedioate aldolase
MNFLKDKIIKKRTLRGMWSLIPNNLVTEVLSISGLDFIILDMEHGNFSKIDIENSIVVCELNGCSPLVRVPLMEKGNIQSALDSGSHGFVFP